MSQCGESGSTARSHIAQIQEKREDSGSALAILLVRNVIVVRLVELSFFVLEYLVIFAVDGWDPHDLTHSVHDLLHYRIVAATTSVRTPGVLGRATAAFHAIEASIEILLAHIPGALISLIVSYMYSREGELAIREASNEK